MRNSDSSRLGAVPATCPMCGHDGLRFVQKRVLGDRSYTLSECRDCGVHSWDPRADVGGSTYYESESLAMYRDMHDEARVEVTDQRTQRLLEGHGRLKGRRVLDIGCGSGRLLWPLAQQGNEVWGVDFDARSIEAARRRGLVNVSCESVEDFVERAHAKNLTFDLITAFDVIEHLVDPLPVLVKLRGLLVPGGRFVVTVPNRKRLLVNRIGTDFPPHHFFRFDQSSLVRSLEHAGYAQVTCDEFEYGYAGALTLDVVRRFGRRAGRSQRAAGPLGSREPEVLKPLPGRAAEYLRKTLPRTLNRLSAPLERLAKRGFKLYASGIRT